jgi:ferredoxin
MKRQIIEIDQEKCTGCGQCIPGCPEGALRIIDGKARLIGDLFCDGLGACIGNCPEGAITVTERESEPYDENKVMENIVKQGDNVIEAHLAHLKEHGQDDLLARAVQFLRERGMSVEAGRSRGPGSEGLRSRDMRSSDLRSNDNGSFGCPGSRSTSFAARGGERTAEGVKPSHAGSGEAASGGAFNAANSAETASAPPDSELTHWPVQLHLISPTAPQYRDRDVVLSADCVAYAIGDFHARYLKGKSLAIACPKLDEGQEIYLEKLVQLIDAAHINTLSVLTMEVPCCRGLLMLAKEAQQRATRKVPVKSVVVSIRGDILQENWL